MTRRLTDFSAVSYGERILKRVRCTFCRPGYRLSAAIDWGFWRHRLVMEAIIFFLVLTKMVRRIFTHASQLRRNAIFYFEAAQSTTVHDGLLHPHLRHCSSAASAVRRLPSAVRTATPAFDVRSSGFFCSRPGGLELVTRLPARSVTFR